MHFLNFLFDFHRADASAAAIQLPERSLARLRLPARQSFEQNTLSSQRNQEPSNCVCFHFPAPSEFRVCDDSKSGECTAWRGAKRGQGLSNRSARFQGESISEVEKVLESSNKPAGRYRVGVLHLHTCADIEHRSEHHHPNRTRHGLTSGSSNRLNWSSKIVEGRIVQIRIPDRKFFTSTRSVQCDYLK